MKVMEIGGDYLTIYLEQHHTILSGRFVYPSVYIFSVSLHKNAHQYIWYSLRFLFCLTKNLTVHLGPQIMRYCLSTNKINGVLD